MARKKTTPIIESTFVIDGMTLEESNSMLTIAKTFFKLSTLESRNSDDLDFHSVSVVSIRNALKAAYIAGERHALRAIKTGK